MSVHELGHVVGALISGGEIKRVVLYPLTISRTDVAPNPNPALVVWLGPVLGALIPLVLTGLIPRKLPLIWGCVQFFAGFCLIANGAYIAIGMFDGVGDCGEMLRTGSPAWTLLMFGMLTIPAGFYLWHRLGSLRYFISDPTIVSHQAAYWVAGFLILVVVAGFAFSPI